MWGVISGVAAAAGPVLGGIGVELAAVIERSLRE